MCLIIQICIVRETITIVIEIEIVITDQIEEDQDHVPNQKIWQSVNEADHHLVIIKEARGETKDTHLEIGGEWIVDILQDIEEKIDMVEDLIGLHQILGKIRIIRGEMKGEMREEMAVAEMKDEVTAEREEGEEETGLINKMIGGLSVLKGTVTWEEIGIVTVKTRIQKRKIANALNLKGQVSVRIFAFTNRNFLDGMRKDYAPQDEKQKDDKSSNIHDEREVPVYDN